LGKGEIVRGKTLEKKGRGKFAPLKWTKKKGALFTCFSDQERDSGVEALNP